MYSVIIAFLLVLFGLLELSPGVHGGRSPRKGQLRDIVKDTIKTPRTRSEELAISIVEKLTGKKFPSVRPAWLLYNGHQLELDGYNEELQVALEFQGPLHTKFYPQKESYSAYYERLLRDKFKRTTCKKRGVCLVIVDMKLPSHLWPAYIQSRLADAGKSERPTNYIEKQKVRPYRNEHAEAELGLFGLASV